MSLDGRLRVQPYLDQEPPPWAAHALAWVLLILAGTALTVSIVLRVPESVSAEFVLAPVHRVDPVKAFRTGLVSVVGAVAGQRVRAGDRLFVIASHEASDRAGELAGVERQLSGGQERVDNLNREYERTHAADEAELARLDARASSLAAQLVQKQKELDVATEIARRYEETSREGLASWVDVGRTQADAARTKAELEELEGNRVDTRATAARLRMEMAARESAHREDARRTTETLDQARIRRGSLTQSPSDRMPDLRLEAPCDGTVIVANVAAPGAVVQQGDTLAEVACVGQQLRAELRIPQRGLGRVRVGQTVKLKYEAFPYERFGAAPAIVEWISPAGEVATGGAFRAFATLQQGGPSQALLGPGLVGEAEIVVDRRRLASYLIDPLRQLREELK